MSKPPEIEVLEALLAVCGHGARKTGPLARAYSERHAKLSSEHAKLMRDMEREEAESPSLSLHSAA